MVGKEILKKPKNNSDAQKKRIKELESQLDSATSQLKQLRAAKFKLALGKPKNTKGSQHCRVIVPDSHGCLVDKKAAKAFFHDLGIIKPSQIVCLGDHIDCGGFLAQHHTMGYVAQTEYTFSDDEHAANIFLDTLQEIANCETIYIEGNHERRIENWITTQTLKNTKDAEWLKERFSIETVLNLTKRGFRHIEQGKTYDKLKLPGTVKLGNCYFTHGSSTSQHAASAHVKKFGGNVVYGHTHRADSYIIRQVKSGTIGAWSPGCLCELQPLWQHTNPTEWSHGYGLQMVRSNGDFLHINVPIVDGKSLLSPLVDELK